MKDHLTFAEEDISLILKAVKFSAERHKKQRRKGVDGSPYINHPIEVAETLWRIGGVRDVNVITAAILHDTVEDTETTPEEVGEHFGAKVRALVEEVTDDKQLPKPERKRLQVEHAPTLSTGAKQIKLADKIYNIDDVAFRPPNGWSLQRRSEYLAWADRVVMGLRGCNQQMEEHYDAVMRKARQNLEAEERGGSVNVSSPE